VLSRRSGVEHGGEVWTLADVEDPTSLRLYRAVAEEHSILLGGSRRMPVSP
jgi:hypothetical protein